MDMENAPDKENEQGHEIIDVFVLSGNKRIKAFFELDDNNGNEVKLSLTFAGRSYRSHAPTYFEAMNKIRLILEKDNIYPICYGACENIYPSGTTISVATGRAAYRCTPGKPVLSNDIVDIFDADGFCMPVTVQAQKQFNLKWRESIIEKKAKKKIRIGPKFRNACFIMCVLLWCYAIIYYFLGGDAASGAVIFLIIMLGCAAVFFPILPFFEFVSKPDSKTRDAMAAIPVEKQLSVLAELGVKLRQESFIEWLCDERSRAALESNPYSHLLFSFGSRRLNEHDKKWEWLSDDAYTFDAECVEGHDLYADVLERLAALSKGIFNAKNISGGINHEQKSASVSFSLEGIDYSWHLRYDDDWFDVLVIGRINTLLKNMGSEKFFFMSVPGRVINIVFCAEETMTRLNGLIPKPYVLEFSEDDNRQRLSFSLRTNYASFSNNMLCAGMLGVMLSHPEPDDFLVLAPEAPIGSSTFLQVGFSAANNPAKKPARKTSGNTPKNPHCSYALEAGFGGKRRSVAIYRLNTNDKDVVLRHIVDYWRNQKIPDVSSWENVSGELS